MSNDKPKFKEANIIHYCELVGECGLRLILGKEIVSLEYFVNDDLVGKLWIARRKDGFVNLINTSGEFIFKKWYLEIQTTFFHGLFKVQRDDLMWTIITSEDKKWLTSWYLEISNCNIDDDNHFVVVTRKDGKKNIIALITCILLSKYWFFDVKPINLGNYIVQNTNTSETFNILDCNGKFKYKNWFNNIRDYHNDFAIVENSQGLFNFINMDGEIISSEWFINASKFSEDGLAYVFSKDSKNIVETRNLIYRSGKLMSNVWYREVFKPVNGLARVHDCVKGYNFIDSEGKLLSGKWFRDAWDFNKGVAHVYVVHKDKTRTRMRINVLGELF